jgi:4-hydroxybenzoate polyprenyltransferase
MTPNIHSLASVGFWRAYVTTMRPYLLFVSGAAGMVGLAFAQNPPEVISVLAFLALFLSYGFGQALTDCFQMDTDAISSPYRPLVKGLISRKQVLSVSLVGLLSCGLAMAYVNPLILLFAMVSVLGLVAYTSFKRTWWGGPPCDSLVAALLPVMGRLIDRGWDPRELVRLGGPSSLAFLLAVLAVFCAYANFVVIGYFKDISADRATGYRTFQVAFGWQPAALYSDLMALAAAGLTGAMLLLTGHVNPWAGIAFALALFVNAYAQVAIHRIRDEAKAHGPIANVVRAFMLYCVAMIVSLKAEWAVLMAAFYLLFELSLWLRPEKTQV